MCKKALNILLIVNFGSISRFGDAGKLDDSYDVSSSSQTRLWEVGSVFVILGTRRQQRRKLVNLVDGSRGVQRDTK